MNPISLAALNAAIAPITKSVQQFVQENAKVCKEMQGSTESGKTKPPKRERPLAPRRRMAIELLLAGRTIASIARELSVDESTIHRWKQDPRFNEEVRRRVYEIARPAGRNSRADLQGFARKCKC